MDEDTDALGAAIDRESRSKPSSPVSWWYCRIVLGMLPGSLGVLVNCARCLENRAGIGDCVISIVSFLSVRDYSVQGKCNQPRVAEIDRCMRWEICVFDLGGFDREHLLLL